MDRALYRFSRPTGQILGLVGVSLIFLPKLNLVQLQVGAAGLRIDDVVLLSCFMFFASVFLYYSTARPRKIELAFAGWMVALLVSNFVNVALYSRSSYLYSLRFIEYFLFFYFGYYFAQRYKIRTLAKAILWINGIVMVLQMFHVVGGFASAGYSTKPDRPLGLTGGPWEIGVLINFCLAIFLFDGKVTRKAAIQTVLVTSALLILTASRMAILAQLAIIIAYYRQQGRNVLPFLLKSSAAVAVLAALVWFVPNPLQERSQKLFDMQNLRYLQQMYERTPDNPSLDEFFDFEVQEDSDMSWVMRVSKWTVVAKLWMRDSTSPFFGLGPGSIGVALDGGWLRIIIETGLLGLISLLVLARSLWCISPPVKIMVVVIAINMLMTDIYLAYKVMAFLFFAAGYFIFQNESASRRLSPHEGPSRAALGGGSEEVWLR
jgi:hypothetical protein